MAESVGSEGSGAAGSGAASAAASGCDVSELGSEEGWDAIDLSVLSDSHPPPLPTTAFAGALRTHVAALKWTTEQVEVLFARNSGADIREDSAASVDEVVALLRRVTAIADRAACRGGSGARAPPGLDDDVDDDESGGSAGGSTAGGTTAGGTTAASSLPEFGADPAGKTGAGGAPLPAPVSFRGSSLPTTRTVVSPLLSRFGSNGGAARPASPEGETPSPGGVSLSPATPVGGGEGDGRETASGEKRPSPAEVAMRAARSERPSLAHAGLGGGALAEASRQMIDHHHHTAQMHVRMNAFKVQLKLVYKELILETDHHVTGNHLPAAMERIGRPVDTDFVDEALGEHAIFSWHDEDRALPETEFVQLGCFIEEQRVCNVAEECHRQQKRLVELSAEEQLVRVIGNGRSWVPGIDLLDPGTSGVQCFDILVMLVLIIVFFTLPLAIAFEEVNDGMLIINIVFDAIFMLDVFKHFNVGYFTSDMALVMDRHRIARAYVKGWFFVDVITSIPLSDIMYLLRRNGEYIHVLRGKNGLKLLKLLRVTKLLKMFRGTQLLSYLRATLVDGLESLSIKISDALTKMISLLIMLATLAHWLGCMLYCLVRLYGYPRTSWVVQAGLISHDGKALMSVVDRYLWCVHKILLIFVSVAYEYPGTAQTCIETHGWCKVESWLTLVCLYIGTLFYALLISNLSAIVVNANVAQRRFEEQLTTTLEFLRYKKIPKRVCKRVHDYYYLRYSEGRLFDEAAIFNNMSPELRKEVWRCSSRELIPKVPLFREHTASFFDSLVLSLTPTMFFPGDCIVQEGSIGKTMYFIHTGLCEIRLHCVEDDSVRVLADGCFFGEGAILLKRKRSATVRANTMVETFVLGEEQLLTSCEEFPEIQEYLVRLAKQRIEWLRHLDISLSYRDVDPAVIAHDYVDPEDALTPLYQLLSMEVAPGHRLARHQAGVAAAHAHHGEHSIRQSLHQALEKRRSVVAGRKATKTAGGNSRQKRLSIVSQLIQKHNSEKSMRRPSPDSNVLLDLTAGGPGGSDGEKRRPAARRRRAIVRNHGSPAGETIHALGHSFTADSLRKVHQVSCIEGEHFQYRTRVRRASATMRAARGSAG